MLQQTLLSTLLPSEALSRKTFQSLLVQELRGVINLFQDLGTMRSLQLVTGRERCAPWDLSARSNQQFLELACTGRCICPFISLRSTISILPVCGVYAAATFANKIETCNAQLIGLCQNPQLLNTDFCDTTLLEEGFSLEHQHNICLHGSVATCAGLRRPCMPGFSWFCFGCRGVELPFCMGGVPLYPVSCNDTPLTSCSCHLFSF